MGNFVVAESVINCLELRNFILQGAFTLYIRQHIIVATCYEGLKKTPKESIAKGKGYSVCTEIKRITVLTA